MLLTNQDVLDRISEIHEEQPMYGHPLWTGMVEGTWNFEQSRYICQRNSGSAFATLLVFKKDTVEVTGQSLSTFSHKGGSGQLVYRSFCRECGSPVYAEYEVTPDFRVISAGTLDDSELIEPQWNIYTASKQPWVELSPDRKSFEGGLRKE